MKIARQNLRPKNQKFIKSNRNIKLSNILLHSNHIAQIVLCVVAIGGYFYTVRPIHIKELLEEEIAEKQLELNKKQNEITKMTSTLEGLNNEISVNQKNVANIKKNAKITYEFARQEALINIYESLDQCEYDGPDVDDAILGLSIMDQCVDKVSKLYFLNVLNAKDKAKAISLMNQANQSFKKLALPLIQDFVNSDNSYGVRISEMNADDVYLRMMLEDERKKNFVKFYTDLNAIKMKETDIDFDSHFKNQ